MEHVIKGHTAQRFRENYIGTVFVVFSAVLFSIGGLFIKMVPWNPMAINGARCFLAFLVYFTYLKVTKHTIVFNKTVLFAAVCNFLTGYTFVVATKLTSAANAIVLQFTQPIFVILFLWLIFHNRPSKSTILTCAVAFAGMMCFFLDKLTPDGMIGNLIAVFSGICYAFVFIQKKMPGADMDSAMMFSCLLGAVIGCPSVLKETDFSGHVLLYIAILGIFQFGAALVFLAKGLQTVQPFTAAVSSMIEPILNPTLVAIFYGETIGPVSLLGACLVIGASTYYSIKEAMISSKQGNG